jgi:hypothetical protein
MMILDEIGKQFLAVDVFAISLKYLHGWGYDENCEQATSRQIEPHWYRTGNNSSYNMVGCIKAVY